MNQIEIIAYSLELIVSIKLKFENDQRLSLDQNTYYYYMCIMRKLMFNSNLFILKI